MVDATWTGAGGTNAFLTGANWTGGSVPNGVATFGAAGPTNVSVGSPTDGTDVLSVGAFNFTTASRAFTFNFQHSDGGSFDLLQFTGAGVTGVAGYQVTFNLTGLWYQAELSGNASLGHANLVTEGGIFFIGNSTAGHSKITLNKSTTASGAQAIEFLQNATAGDADIRINHGGLNFRHDSSADGAKVYIASGASMTLGSSSSMTFGSLAGGGQFVLGPKPVTVGSLGLNDVISGQLISPTGGQLIKVGAGVLTLSGSQDQHRAAMVVREGELRVYGSISNSSGVTVEANGLLSGLGAVSGVTVEGGGEFAPGDSSDATALLSTGALNLKTGATLKVDVDGSSAGLYDRLAVAGSVTLGGALQVSELAGAASLPANASLKIIDNDGADAVVGTFAGLAEGAQISLGGEDFKISYRGGDGNDVVLTAVAPANTPPTLSATPLNPQFTEGAGLGVQGADVALFAGAALSAVDAGQRVTGLTFTFSGLKDGASETIIVDGRAIALGGASSGTTDNGVGYAVTISGSVATVTLTRAAGLDSAVVNGLAYRNSNLDNPTAGDRVVTLTEVRDDGADQNVTALSIASTINVAAINDAPTIVAPAMLTVAEDGAASLTGVVFGDVDPVASPVLAETPRFTLNVSSGVLVTPVGNPHGFVGSGTSTLSLRAGDTTILTDVLSLVRFQPDANSNDDVVLTVTLHDRNPSHPEVQTATQQITLKVAPGADTPSAPSIVIDEDTQATGVQIARNAADGAEVTLVKVTAIANGALYKADGVSAVTDGAFITFAEAAALVFKPAPNFNGVASFNVQAATAANDAALGGDVATATITVNPVNDAPTNVHPIPDQAASEGAAFSYTVAANAFADIDAGDALTYSATLADGSSLPAWLSFNAATQAFSGTPPFGEAGELTIRVTATDQGSAQAFTDFKLAIIDSNAPPTLTATALNPTFAEGDGYGAQGASVLLFSNATLDAADVGQNVTGLTLKMERAYNGADDKLIIDGTTIALGQASSGTTSNGVAYQVAKSGLEATVVLTRASGLDADLVNSIRYINTKVDNPDARTRVVALTEARDDGASANVATLAITSTIAIHSKDDLPAITAPAALTVAEGGELLLDGFSFADPDGKRAPVSPAQPMRAIVEVSSGTLHSDGISGDETSKLTFVVSNLDILTSAFEDAVSFRPAAGSTDDVTLTVTIYDGLIGDGRTDSATHTMTIQVTPVDDAPTLAATALNPTFTEGAGTSVQGADVALFTGAALDAVDAGQKVTGLTFTVSGLKDGASEIIIVDGRAISLGGASSGITDNDVGYTVTISGDVATVTLTRADGLAAGIVNGLSYRNTNLDNPTAGDRIATLTEVRDDGASANTTPLSLPSTIQVRPTNDSPSLITAIPDQTASEGAAFSYPLIAGAFIDRDAGDALTYAATLADGSLLPAWLSFNPATQTFSGTPPFGQAGDLAIRVTATDLAGAIAFDDFKLTIADTNRPPTLTATALNPTFTEGVGTSVQGADVALFTGAALDAVDAGQKVTGLIFTVSGLKDGANEVIIVDGRAISLGDASADTTTNGVAYAVTIAGDVATVTLTRAAGIDAEIVNSLSYRNTNLDSPTAGDRVATLTEARDDGASANATPLSLSSTIHVQPTNDAPFVFSGISDQAASEGAAFSYKFTADAFVDRDAGDVLAYAATLADGSLLPAWLSFNPATQTFSGTPPFGQAGDLAIRVTATDQSDAKAIVDFTLRIADSNRTPTLTATAINPTFTEGAGTSVQGAPVALFSNAALDARDAGQKITGLTFTVARLADGDHEVVVVDGRQIKLGAASSGTTDNGVGYAVTILGDTATVTLTRSGGLDAGVVNGLTYLNTNLDSPTFGGRRVTLTELRDDGADQNVTPLSILSSVVVTPINDAPAITAPATMTVDEDGTLSLAGIVFSDIDGKTTGVPVEQPRFGLVVSSGELSVQSFSGPELGAHGPSMQSLTNLLSTVNFKPVANATGDVTLTVTLHDGNPHGLPTTLSATQEITIRIRPIADTPRIVDVATDEDVDASGFQIARNAVDGAEVTHIKVSGIANGALFKADGVTAVADGDFVTFADAAGLIFRPTANFHGDGGFDIQAATSASDAGLGGAIVHAAITVRSVADAPVDITLSRQAIDENSPAGTIVGELSAIAPDGGSIIYSLTGAGADLFEIDGATVKVKAGAVLDFEGAAQSHDLIVTASSGGAQAEPVTFTIAVGNVNEAPTGLFAQAPGGGDDPLAITENTAVRTEAATIFVKDPDDPAAFAPHQFAVDDDRFEIVDGKLYLKAGQATDFETEPEISLAVTVTDGEMSFTKEEILILVRDVAEGGSGGPSTPGDPTPNGPTPTPTNEDIFGKIPALVVSSFVEGEVPETTARLQSLSEFAHAQYLAYQARGVLTPQLGPYEALGLGFSETIDFQDRYGALSEPEFVSKAYQDVFGRAATAAQLDHFQAQIHYFQALYASVSIPDAKGLMMAIGAALGQMLGAAVLDEPNGQPYYGQAQAFLADAADGVVEMGRPLSFYDAM